MPSQPQFANTGVLGRKLSSLRDAGFIKYADEKPSEFIILNRDEWHELGLALFTLWLAAGGPIVKRRQGVVHRLSESQSLLVLRGNEDAMQICVPELFAPDSYSRRDWCQVPVELKRAWMRSQSLPEPTADDMAVLDCSGNHDDHVANLNTWLQVHLATNPQFGQLATGLPGDGLVLDVRFEALRLLLGGLATQASEGELEQLFNSYLALSLAEILRPAFCESETHLIDPLKMDQGAFDALLWNREPNYLIALETTRETGREPESKPFADIMEEVAKAFGVPRQVAVQNRYHKAKQKLAVAGALRILQQDVYEYVFITLAPKPDDFSTSIDMALQQDHVHAVWWPRDLSGSFFALQRGELEASGLRAAFDEYLASSVAAVVAMAKVA